MRYISYAKRVAKFVFSLCQRIWIAGIFMSYLSYPVRWQVMALLLHYNVVSLCRGFVATELVCLSLGWRIGTDTGCSGCRRVERPVWCEEHTQNRNRNRGDSISIIPTRTRQDGTNDVQIEIEKEGRKRRKTKIKSKSRTQEKKTAHKGNTQTCRLASSAGGV